MVCSAGCEGNGLNMFKGSCILKRQSWHQGGVVLLPEGWVVVNDTSLKYVPTRFHEGSWCKAKLVKSKSRNNKESLYVHSSSL